MCKLFSFPWGTCMKAYSASLSKTQIEYNSLLYYKFRSSVISIIYWYVHSVIHNCAWICPECSAMEMGQFPICKLNGIFWGLPLQHVQFIKAYFLPHLESFIWERKFEKRNFKKYPIQPPNWVLPICKLPFPNGSYRNGVCRGLWAQSISRARLVY